MHRYRTPLAQRLTPRGRRLLDLGAGILVAACAVALYDGAAALAVLAR